jgi:hypothetical protein
MADFATQILEHPAPAGAADVDRALAGVAAHRFAILSNLLDPVTLDRARTALHRGRRHDPDPLRTAQPCP